LSGTAVESGEDGDDEEEEKGESEEDVKGSALVNAFANALPASLFSMKCTRKWPVLNTAFSVEDGVAIEEEMLKERVGGVRLVDVREERVSPVG
jgi:hypothetical protein